ncbi:MAG TPA: DUF742 domain-containing protein [Pseudonocardiaceae bacterium]|jgi:hypothetical protein|nr:DUF742 domain-containing protein [Pseudonocardiaceae bacterium]
MTMSFGPAEQPDPSIEHLTAADAGLVLPDRVDDPAVWQHPTDWPDRVVTPPVPPNPVGPPSTVPSVSYPPSGSRFGDSGYFAIDDFGDEASRVRPYAWTGGRTRASVDLQLETLISTSDLGEDEALLTQVEYRAVGTLCRHPHSVAEVAAKLSVPLGVAKVILSDMAELGLISIHRTFADDDIAAHLVLMERVLSGLRRL